MHLANPNPSSRRPSLHTTIPSPALFETYSDSRTHGPQVPSRHVRIARATSYGGGSIAKSEDGLRCVVAGKESLRILRISPPTSTSPSTAEHKFVVGRGGYRIDASRNFWNGSGLKIDSASTDVAWGHGIFSHKILTGARNGELIMWDLNKSGPSKYERRIRDHVRSIHKLAYSTVLQYYCMTGSADGDIRVWDLRDLSRSIMKIHHPISVRAVVFSPVPWQPRHAIVGLDNGSIYRWDLNMGQRGQLDRIPVAHTGPILALDWVLPASSTLSSRSSAPSSSQSSTAWLGGVGAGLLDDLGGFGAGSGLAATAGGNTGPDGAERSSMGWLASGGLDRCVKVWDLTPAVPEAHISRRPVYTLHTSFPVRRVLWRPGAAYECELAVVSNVEFGAGTLDSAPPSSAPSPHMPVIPLPLNTIPTILHGGDGLTGGIDEKSVHSGVSSTPIKSEMGDPVEIWDVRRGYVAKWTVRGSAIEGGVTDIAFGDSHAMWAQHVGGSFSQFDLRQTTKPLDAIPRVATSWDAAGSLMFVADKPKHWEVPYDDISPERRQIIQDRKEKLKALGDPPYVPSSQTVGMVGNNGLMDGIETFVRLAQGYIFEGASRANICAHNAGVAIEAGKHDAAQAWLLLESLLVDLAIPPSSTPLTSSLSPLPLNPPPLPHSSSAPGAIQNAAPRSASTPVSTPLPIRSFSAGMDSPHNIGRRTSGSPVSLSRLSPDKPSASFSSSGYLSPQRITPTSSTASSPRRIPSTLPPLPAAIFARRGSNSGLSTLGHTMTPSSSVPQQRPRLFSSHSSYRRPSFAAPSVYSMSAHSESPSETSLKNVYGSLRHVGEGALSDSDEEDEGSGRSLGARSDADSDIDDHVYSRSNSSSADPSGSGSGQAAGGNSSIHASETSQSSRPSISPYLYPRSSISISTHPNPSPLSRVAGQQNWSEDEYEKEDDDDDSPSPASSSNSDSHSDLSDGEGEDTEVSSSSSRRARRSKVTRKSSVRSHLGRTRSRSSTVASLSVSASASTSESISGPSLQVRPPKLTKQESQSSIRTVTAVNSPGADNDAEKGRGLQRDDTVRDLSNKNSMNLGHGDAVVKPSTSSPLTHRRLRSAISSEFFLDTETHPSLNTSLERRSGRERRPNSNGMAIEEEYAREVETRVRDVGWEALRETIEFFADEGDVQMCTMLTLVAREELKISKARMVRFLEAYIEILARLRFHTFAAYMRKYAPDHEIQHVTSLETTMYTSCGRCRKPMLLPAIGPALTTTPTSITTPLHNESTVLKPKPKAKPLGSYAYCLACKEASSRCSICHLPVRALLFKCTVCMHGGHQECYQNYYLRRPMVELKPGTVQPPQSKQSRAHQRPPIRGRTISKTGDGDGSDDGIGGDLKDVEGEEGIVNGRSMSILGHPCAAGCGHFCWGANDGAFSTRVA